MPIKLKYSYLKEKIILFMNYMLSEKFIIGKKYYGFLTCKLLQADINYNCRFPHTY